MKVIKIIIFVLLGLSLALPAIAQEKRARVIELGTIEVRGSVQKPSAFFVNGRRPFIYERPVLKESFVGEVIKPAKNNSL